MRWVKSIRFVFCLVNLMAQDISDYQFLDKSWLEQVLESVLSRNLLSLANETDDLVDIIHCVGRGYLFRRKLSRR